MRFAQSKRHSSDIIVIAVLVYLTSSLLFGVGLYLCLTLGMFPPEADSIGIPFAGFMMLWFVGLVLGILAWVMLLVSNSGGGQRRQ